jgi:hypothetical protein
MDVSSIAATATSLAQARTSDQLNIEVAAKANKIQKALATQLIAGIPPAPVTSSMGHSVNTTA